MITAIATQKGGTVKTTTSISLAAGLARFHKKKILLIDIDSQANSNKVLVPKYRSLDASQKICTTLLNRNPLPIHPSNVPGLDIVPSHILLYNADVELVARYSNQIILMHQGTIYKNGSPTAVMQTEHVEQVYGVSVKIVEDPFGIGLIPMHVIDEPASYK